MNNSMAKDYKEMVIKPQFDFMRNHWKGCLVVTAACAAVPYVVYKARELAENIKYKREFDQFEKEES